ncbi:unnamed protein product [Linum trigynum]|uniref:Uncharacterized protein n=1 Tax=Linum trigynum TaxID=586398 RepID=A0AAV2GKD3_9ROSI
MDGKVIRAGVIKTTAALVDRGLEDSDTPLIHMYELFKSTNKSNRLGKEKGVQSSIVRVEIDALLNEVHVDVGVRMEEEEENERGTNISPQIDEEDR